MSTILEMHVELMGTQQEAANHVARLEGQAESMSVLYTNQQKLSETSEALDDRFAVMFRIVMGTLNELRDEAGKEAIGPKVLESEFKDWTVFKTHPKWRDHTPFWYMGKDVSEVLKEAKELSVLNQLKEPVEDQSNHAREFTPDEIEEAEAVLSAAGLSPNQDVGDEPSTDQS